MESQMNNRDMEILGNYIDGLTAARRAATI